jgi:sporulation protein YlmC with PRC-barrel domain
VSIPTRYTIGAEARCSDGSCGTVSRVVVDPIAVAITHLVVEPRHRRGLGKLVPLNVVAATDGGVRLSCTLEEFENLESAEETEFLPGPGHGDYGADQVLRRPYYRLGLRMGMGIGGFALGDLSEREAGLGSRSPRPLVHDTVPLGEVAIRRGDHVHATDGDIGRVQGLVVDPDTRHVTHVLLQEGHLWGAREVAIPIAAAARIDADGIKLDLTKEQIRDLPSVPVEPPDAIAPTG